MKTGCLFDFRNPHQWAQPYADLYNDTIDDMVAVEELGFDTAWTTEHHFLEDGYLPSQLAVLSAVAARTQRIGLGTFVLLLPLHDPVRVAEDAAVVDLCEFGIPQHRSRAFLTLVRKDTDAIRVLKRTGRAPFPSPTHGGPDSADFVTIDDALRESGLPALDAGSAEGATSNSHPMHRVPVWLDRRYEMVAAIPPGSGASAWETDRCGLCDTKGIASTEAVCPKCQSRLLRPTVRNEDGSWRLVKGFRSSSYRRMDPTRPAATITTASGHIGSDRTLHPWENRVLSPAECGWLQTIPSSFQWGDSMDKWGPTGVRQMIGEAVPPLFTMLHGRVLAALAEGSDVPEALSQEDGRCRKALAKLDG